jgi:ribosomal protein S18 acetylase RimI-like enzyme
VEIREATDADWPRIWPFWHEIIAAGDTYDWDPETDEPTARGYWMQRPPGRTFVAADGKDGEIAGTYKMGPNRAKLGDHIANTSYMVDPARHGKGVGRKLVEHSIEQCRSDGYRAIVFNAVIETNVYAVKLYLDLGFEIIGTIPAGFRHPTRGFVGYHIMHLKL